MSAQKTAVITGGASGMGLAVALSLLSEGWMVNILDLNAAAGQNVTQKHPGLKFTQVDVTSWASLSSAFDAIYKAHGRMDFVFANAGILQLENFYEKDAALPPSEPRQNSIDINLKAVINTCHLARHYFLASDRHPEQDPVLVTTASIASFYAQEFNPLYSASKAGVLAFVRSVASPFQAEGIRTYALCPGTVRTNLLSQSAWDTFPEEYLTPVETIVSTVQKLILGGEMEDGRGRKISRAENYGLAVEVFCQNFYI
ncbi:hypothetical protein F5X68DRAFT_106077, partial [Plectosphaerella plurivora]